MLRKQVFLGSWMIIITIIFHAFCLVNAIEFLTWLSDSSIFWQSQTGKVFQLTLVVLLVVLIHSIETLIWALLFLKLGEFEQISKALYFSAVTGTSLGYGDIVLTEKWQILGTFESMGGLLLFGTSVAYLIHSMEALLLV